MAKGLCSAASLVHFMPGARTHWHRHPLGQTVFVTEGIDLCQRRGGPLAEVIHRGSAGTTSITVVETAENGRRRLVDCGGPESLRLTGAPRTRVLGTTRRRAPMARTR